MNEILAICIISYAITLVVLHVFTEKRLNRLHKANIQRVPAENNDALNILHFRLKTIVRVLSFLLLVGGVFILVTLL